MPNGQDIAKQTKTAWEQDRTTGRPSTDPSYAVEALKANVASQMRAQGEAATKQIKGSMKKGGKVPATGMYKLHKGEKVIAAKKSRMLANALNASGVTK